MSEIDTTQKLENWKLLRDIMSADKERAIMLISGAFDEVTKNQDNKIISKIVDNCSNTIYKEGFDLFFMVI